VRHLIYTIGSRRLETTDDSYYVAPGAHVIGSVRLGREASVWFSAVLRGDNDWLIIGDGSNVQDGAVIHTDPGFPVNVGRNVTIGHLAFLHGCTVGDDSMIANGAMVLDRARIGRNCIVAAGALVPPGKEIPDGSVVMGAPGSVVRQVSEKDLAMIAHAGASYRRRSKEYQGLTVDSRSTAAHGLDAHPEL
jgi:carbonic anhydrase/acetyltransferase-like protein (isoleucine patch superfamily)